MNINEVNKPIALSFFSGCMGLDLGVESAGFDIRFLCEFDKYCQETIKHNRPNVSLSGDIRDLDAATVRKMANLSSSSDIDLIMGGPPCQAFSTAGKRKGFQDSRGNVFLKYIDLALELSPKYIVIENVRGLLSCPMEHRPHDQRGDGFPDLSEDELKGGALNFVLCKLKRSGYGVSFNLYNAANFGSPQIRERIVIVCSRDGSVAPFLEPTHCQDEKFELLPWKTIRNVFEGITEHHHLAFPEKRLKYYRMLKSGENWRGLPEGLQKEALGKSFYAGGGKTGFLRRLDWGKPSPTLVTSPIMPATDLAHPVENRPLSVEEYKRIQEFPDEWFLSGPIVQQYKQIGNAVPISLGKAIGSLIYKLLTNREIQKYPLFSYSRYRNTDHIQWAQEFARQISKHQQAQILQEQPTLFDASK